MTYEAELDALRKADEHYRRVLAELGPRATTDEMELIREQLEWIAADVKRLRARHRR